MRAHCRLNFRPCFSALENWRPLRGDQHNLVGQTCAPFIKAMSAAWPNICKQLSLGPVTWWGEHVTRVCIFDSFFQLSSRSNNTKTLKRPFVQSLGLQEPSPWTAWSAFRSRTTSSTWLFGEEDKEETENNILIRRWRRSGGGGGRRMGSEGF